MLLIFLSGMMNSAWADDGLMASPQISNSGKTCTWYASSISATIAKGTTQWGGGLGITASTSNGYNRSGSSGSDLTLNNASAIYVQVPSASSEGNINFTDAGGNQSDRYLTLKYGGKIEQNKSSDAVPFTSSDIESINNGYYIKLTNTGNFDFKFKTIIVNLTSGNYSTSNKVTISWRYMATEGCNADKAGASTSRGITPADGSVKGLTGNARNSDKTYYRYKGFGTTADVEHCYFEYSFNIATGYTFTPTDITVGWSPNGSKYVSFDVYIGTTTDNLTYISTLTHTSDNLYSEDEIKYTTPFTILRLVPHATNTDKNIILNNVVINGTITEPTVKAYTVTFNNNGHSGNAPAAVTESEVGAGVALPASGGKQGLIPYAGYTFLGWSVDQNATKADDQLWAYRDMYYPASDVTLYAVYRQNPIGSAHTAWWHAFSGFTKFDVGKAYTATFKLVGGSHEFINNWALVATSDDNGHNGDGVQNDGSNELFVLRGDGGFWGSIVADGKGTSQLYKYNGTSYDEITVNEVSSDEVKAAFIADMANAIVKVTAARAGKGKKVHVYATAECENGAKYVLTFISGECEGDMYLSFTTDYSSLSNFTADTESAANFLKKADDIEGGSVDKLLSIEGIDITGWGVAEGTQFTAVVTPEGGYTFKNITINGADAGTGILTMPDVEATVSAVFDSEPAEQYSYTVKAVGPNNVVLKANVASGKYTVGDAAVTVAYPQHILVGNDLYEINKQYNGSSDYYRYTFTPDADEYVVNLPYTKNKVSNVIAYVEAERISGFTATTGNANRASNGAAARKDQLCATGVNLETGKTYQIFFRMVNGDAARTVTFNDGTNNICSQEVAKADYSTKSSDLFSVSANTELKVSCAGSGSSGLDWFYVQEINALNVTENDQQFGFTESNVNTCKYASANGVSTFDTTCDNVNGKFYNIKNSSNYVEVTETGAHAFTVYAFHNNSTSTRKVKVYVDGEEVGTVDVTPGSGVTSSVFAIPAPHAGTHTIKLTGAGGDVYVADVKFYTQKTNPTVTPTSMSVSVKQQKQFAVSAPDGCDITSMNSVTSDVADVIYNAGKITVTGKKPGNVTATFNVTSENELFNDGTATVNITVTKAELVMKYNPDAVVIEKGAEKQLPAGLKIDYYVVEDGKERKFDSAPVTPGSYTTTDGTVATVDASGNISFASAAGSTDITASFAGNDLYTKAEASFSILVKDGYEHKMTGDDGTAGPSLDDATRTFVVKDEANNPLVYGTFGGWKRNSHAYAGTSKADAWDKLASYGNAIDGFSRYTSGINDAMNESMSTSANLIYGAKRKGWFESPVTINDEGKMEVTGKANPFSLPVRGTYMTFEPTKNGQLTIYILQNGAWNSGKKDVKDDDGFLVSVDDNGNAVAFPGTAPWQFRPHAFYVVDQSGVPVEAYTDFKVNTKQPIETGIITQEKLDLKSSNGNSVYTDAQKQAVRNFCEKYGINPGDKFKCILDENADGYYDVTNIGNWKEFKQYMSPEEQQRVKDAWNTGVNGAEKIVKLDNGSYLAIDGGIMKYSFYVAAGQTYYLFSNFSKLGYAGCNFVPAEEANQPHATLILNETTKYVAPVLATPEGTGNHVKGITIPQYKSVALTLGQTFTQGNWNTICLPYTLTEKETADIFGTEKDGLELLVMDDFEIEGTSARIHFVYHEIQNILAGYPYIIKPGKDVTVFTVNNKLINPQIPQTAFTFSGYSFKGVYGYCTPGVHSDNSKNYFSKQLKEGDIFLSGNKFWQSTGSSYLRGYRSYIEAPTVQNAPRLTSIFVVFGQEEDGGSGTTTSIEFVDITPDASEALNYILPRDGVYSINGHKVADSVMGLPQGVYIVNGKKIVVK